MEVTLHMFRHAEEDQEHRKVADLHRQGMLTTKGAMQLIDVGTHLKERIPDETNTEVHFFTSQKTRAIVTAMAPRLRLKSSYKNTTFHEPVEDPELDIPKGDRALAQRLLQQMGREAYLQAWAAGTLPPGIEGQTSFNKRIMARTFVRARKLSKAMGSKQKHLVIVTHDGGTSVPSGFGAVFTKLTGLDPQKIEDAATSYKGPMRTTEYIGVKIRNGKALWAEFRGRVFVPGKKGKAWKEIDTPSEN